MGAVPNGASLSIKPPAHLDDIFCRRLRPQALPKDPCLWPRFIVAALQARLLKETPFGAVPILFGTIFDSEARGKFWPSLLLFRA